MKKLALAGLMAVTAAMGITTDVSAQNFGHFGGFGGLGFGLYQPYGIRYSTSVRTPPYFAINPPVYYGQRQRRSYGLSPFAAIPEIAPSSSAAFPYANVAPAGPQAHGVTRPGFSPAAPALVGQVRINPFAQKGEQLVIAED